MSNFSCEKPFAPYPIKKWNDDSAYSNFESGTSKLLPWEFLRRNKCYQSDYELMIKPIEDVNQVELIQKIDNSETRIDKYCIAEPPCLSNETLVEYKKRLKNCKPSLTSYPIVIQKKYNFKCKGNIPPSPRDDNPRNLNFVPSGVSQTLYSKKGISPEGENPLINVQKLHLTIDLSFSDRELLRQFKKKLRIQRLANKEEESFRKSNFHKDKLCLYLKILDAKLNNVSNEKIAEHFFSHLPNDYPSCKGNKLVSKNHAAAKTFSSDKYVNLAAWLQSESFLF